MAAKVVKTVNEELSQQEALALLQKVQSSSLSYVPPIRQKAGDVYIYSPGEDSSRNVKIMAARCDCMQHIY